MWSVLSTLKNLKLTPTSRQVLASSALGLCMAGVMSSLAVPAASLSQMEQPNSTIHFTPDQASWFAGLTLMMSIPGSVIGATICEAVGPRKLYVLLTPLMWLSLSAMSVASWEMIQRAGISEILLLILRVIQGIVAALLLPAGSVYLYEISDRRLRGMITSLADVWASWGFLLCYICGCFLPWYITAWVLPLLCFAPGFFGMLCSPESPLWLARKGREEEANAILKLYRWTEKEALEDSKVASSNTDNSNSFFKSVQLLLNKPNALATVASCTAAVMKELTGFAVIIIYIVHIFDAAGVGLDPRYSSVIVGFIRLLCNSVASILLHHAKRKTLLISGNILACLGATALGLFFYTQSLGYDLAWLGWVPLTCLAMHMIGCAAAIGPTTWVMAVEVLPGKIRSVGFGVALTCYAIAAFVISKTFVSLQTYIGMYGVFWFFASGALTYIIITLLCMPETYGKSLQDIEDYWSNNTKKEKRVYV